MLMVFIGGEIGKTNVETDLGVMISSDLKGNLHTEQTAQKAFSVFFMLNETLFSNPQILKSIYSSL